MKKMPMFFAVLMFLHLSFYVSAQNKNCRLSADDLIHLVGANDRKVNEILFHHCFAVDKAADNGAKANFKRDYNVQGILNHDNVFTVTTGSATLITTSEASFDSYLSALKHKGFRFVSKDDYGSRYVFDKYEVYFSLKNNKMPNPSYGFTIDRIQH